MKTDVLRELIGCHLTIADAIVKLSEIFADYNSNSHADHAVKQEALRIIQNAYLGLGPKHFSQNRLDFEIFTNLIAATIKNLKLSQNSVIFHELVLITKKLHNDSGACGFKHLKYHAIVSRRGRANTSENHCVRGVFQPEVNITTEIIGAMFPEYENFLDFKDDDTETNREVVVRECYLGKIITRVKRRAHWAKETVLEPMK